jgi:DNA-binding MarR family transcriptional regulator
MGLLLHFLQIGEVAERFLRTVCPHELNLTQALACHYLAQRFGNEQSLSGVTPSDLSRMLGCSEAKLVSQLKPLIERELISKSQSEFDSRSRLYCITPAGIIAVKEFNGWMEQLDRQVGLLLSAKQEDEMQRFCASFESALRQGHLKTPATLDRAFINGDLKPNRRKFTYVTPKTLKGCD